MSDFAFNVSKGKIAYYASLPATNDALIVVLLKSAGLGTDALLKDQVSLAAVLTHATEADFTSYARKTVTAATSTPDYGNDWVDVSFGTQTWSSAGGTTNNTLGKLLVCYDADTTSGTDSSILPLTAHDFPVTTTGADLVAQLPGVGFFRAA